MKQVVATTERLLEMIVVLFVLEEKDDDVDVVDTGLEVDALMRMLTL